MSGWLFVFCVFVFVFCLLLLCVARRRITPRATIAMSMYRVVVIVRGVGSRLGSVVSSIVDRIC